MDDATADRRLLLVHAHPDDETLATGGTMARYAAEGVQVTLVTCTLGEEGEVLLGDLGHLAAEFEDALGPHRLAELAAAMAELGVTDHRRLGGDGAFRDSGMVGTASNDRPDCFWRADLLAAARPLVEIMREVRPQVLITYDDFGGYGHPDHIQAHRVAAYAAFLASVPSFAPELGPAWEIEKVYWPAFPRSIVAAAIEAAPEDLRSQVFGGADPAEAPFLVDDDLITTRIDTADYLSAKLAAMRAHATQIDMDSPMFQLMAAGGGLGFGSEYYRIAKGEPVLVAGDLEQDLFAGLP